ncbi:hypothetical protein ACH4CE_36660 [Streptomyces gelaticus]|uniref:hypothetical protein n=1 Tax=Streptomyces gelaticus TaxID=285446 RepID=UPI003787EB88
MSTPQRVANLPDHDRSGDLSHGGENTLVLRRDRGLLHTRCAVRDQHHRPSTHLPGCRRGPGAPIGELLAHPLKDPLGDCEFVPLGPDLRQLLGQAFFEFVQFRAPRVIRSSSSGSTPRIVEGRTDTARGNRQVNR